MSAPFVVIASYPKSGNTWVRLFLDRLIHAGKDRTITMLDHGYYGAARRRIFDALAPAPASELREDEIDAMLPLVWHAAAAQAAFPAVVKTHDQARRTGDGAWLFPPDIAHAVLLLVRHPFDVAVSYARHRGIEIAEAVGDICDPEHRNAAAANALPLPLGEFPGAWDAHAESWLGARDYPVALFRYEDLLDDPLTQFGRLAASAGIACTPPALAAAIAATRFAKLKAEEKESGFRERPQASAAFFRRGRPGAGANVLTADQRAQLSQALGRTMQRLGYAADGSYIAPPNDFLHEAEATAKGDVDERS